MRQVTRLLPAVGLFVALFAARAQAMDCGQCMPTSPCGQGCTICDGIENPDGSCSHEYSTTCGQSCTAPDCACIRDGCTPSFQDTSRSLRGTYAEHYYLYCEHYKVEWVTQSDLNQCNTNPNYWTRSFCDHTKDGYKWGDGAYSCCNGKPSSLFRCDHHHSC